MRPLHYIIAVSALILCTTAYAQTVYQTGITKENVASLRIKYADSDLLERPILTLGEDQPLEISFDELSHNTHQYTYTVRHLNADWRESGLNSSEYLKGFTTQDITDYDYSLNTQQLYTHYRFIFPNEDMQLTKSGNYVIQIYEDGDTEKTIGYVCFSVAEQEAGINATVRSNTDIELAGRYQQLDIDVNTSHLRLTNPTQEIQVVVTQNNRTDNSVRLTQPTFIENNRLRYINNKQLIFEGGNEYHHFDINSAYILGNGVNHIEFDRNYYHAFLFDDVWDPTLPYTTESDADGQYVINAERTEDDDYEADYMWVHFFVPRDNPYFDGSVYVIGDVSFNQLSAANRLQYDNEHKAYCLSLYLKQGAYDYQYLFVPKGKKQGTLQRTEGSYWQTGNEYTIYVYYRPFGSRGDRLVGVKRIN